jgi:murein DD-endopeptidase MepM/ murein hydrolase activator NlpD
MGNKLKFLAAMLLPLVASCSSTNGLIKKDAALRDSVKPSHDVLAKGSVDNDSDDGAFHIVGPGETLRHVCDVYGLDLAKVAKINKIMPPYNLRNGETIFLPAQALISDEDAVRPTAKRLSGGSSLDKAERMKLAGTLRGMKDPSVPYLIFPVPQGVLSSPFGHRWGRFHRGLDIAAPVGNPVLSCAEGRIIFTGSRKGFRSYGNTVLIDHGKGVYTYYAHLSNILVKKDQRIRRGQQIAMVGNTGRSTGPHLHLEVRVNNTMFNPLAYFIPSELSVIRIAKRFTESPMGPVRAHWRVPDLLAAGQ